MTDIPDYSVIDRPEILETVFYPGAESNSPPTRARDLFVEVEPGVRLHCRFHCYDTALPSLLFFHGNGELVMDYDSIAPCFGSAGANLFIADYRGYGMSTGSPTFSTMLADAHHVLETFSRAVREQCPGTGLYLMGRSMGSHPAAELAARHPDQLDGLIICSGFACLERMWKRLEGVADMTQLAATVEGHRRKIESIHVPVLVLHGEFDRLVPPEAATSFYETVKSARKELVMIPYAGHNNIMGVGHDQYFGAIRQFVGTRAGDVE